MESFGLFEAVKLFPVPRSGLYVELRTRDEHCPPHVHVENEEVPWEAQFAFSFVDDAVRLMDVDPVGDAPSTRTIDRIRVAIAVNLPTCRERWWRMASTCCLHNRWTRVGPDGTVIVLAKREPGAVQIARAAYTPHAGQVTLIMKDAPGFAMRAGMGVEQWEP